MATITRTRPIIDVPLDDVVPSDLADLAEPVLVDESVEEHTYDEAMASIPYFKLYSTSIMFVAMLFLIGVGVPLSIYLNNWTGGMAIGAMCAFWGGPSFGTMTGSARVSAHMEKHGH